MAKDREKTWWQPSPGLAEAVRDLKMGLARVGDGDRQDNRTVRLLGVAADSSLSNFLSGARPTSGTNLTHPDTIARQLISGLARPGPARHKLEDPATDDETDYWRDVADERALLVQQLRTEWRVARKLSPRADPSRPSSASRPPTAAPLAGSAPESSSGGSRVRGLASLEASLDAGKNYGDDRVVLMVRPFFDRVGVEEQGYEGYDFALGSCRFELRICDGQVLGGHTGFALEMGDLQIKPRGPVEQPYCDVFQRGHGTWLAEKPPMFERLCDLEPHTTKIGVDLTFPRSALRLLDPGDRVVSSYGDKIESLVLDWLRRKHLSESQEGYVHHLAFADVRREPHGG